MEERIRARQALRTKRHPPSTPRLELYIKCACPLSFNPVRPPMPKHSRPMEGSSVLFAGWAKAEDISGPSTKTKGKTATSKISSSRVKPSREHAANSDRGVDPTARSQVHQMLRRASAVQLEALFDMLNISDGVEVVGQDCLTVLRGRSQTPLLATPPASPPSFRPESRRSLPPRTEINGPGLNSMAGSDMPPSYSPRQSPEAGSAYPGSSPDLPPSTDLVTRGVVSRRSGRSSDIGLQEKKVKLRCLGTRADGKRCLRDKYVQSHSSDDEEMPWFCYNHTKDPHAPTGFRSPQGEWVECSDFIFDHHVPWIKRLSEYGKSCLRQRMLKGPSESDKPGCIYCYQVLQDEDDGYIHFKVGRTDDIVRRMGQWQNQCGMNIVLKGWYPGPPEGARLSEVALEKARVGAGLAQLGKNCIMLERLIHLYLMHIAEKIERELCKCGVRHKEIFTFKLEGLEGEDLWVYLVKPIIQYLQRFVQEYTD